MPNHITNILTINGNQKDIDSVFEKIKIDEEKIGTIDFNKIVPMPESLHLTSGSITQESVFWALSKMPNDECRKYFNLLGGSKDIIYGNQLNSLQKRFSYKDIARVEKSAAEYVPNEQERKLGITDYESLGRMYLKNLEEYGATDWYDWCVNNWGTKWNAYDFMQIDSNSISFQTAWSTPENIIRALSQKYPSLQFEVKFADENFGYNVGEYTYENGEIIKENIPPEGSIEANKMAEEILGYSLEEEADICDDI